MTSDVVSLRKSVRKSVRELSPEQVIMAAMVAEVKARGEAQTVRMTRYVVAFEYAIKPAQQNSVRAKSFMR